MFRARGKLLKSSITLTTICFFKVFFGSFGHLVVQAVELFKLLLVGLVTWQLWAAFFLSGQGK
jgi:hypothetical protein